LIGGVERGAILHPPPFSSVVLAKTGGRLATYTGGDSYWKHMYLGGNMVKKKEKRYFFNVVEECVMNPKYQWGRGGRIEVSEVGHDYPIYEARFFLPCEFMEKFRDTFDFESSNHMPMISWKVPDAKP
jgi:hypothetical protein